MSREYIEYSKIHDYSHNYARPYNLYSKKLAEYQGKGKKLPQDNNFYSRLKVFRFHEDAS